MPKTRKSKGVKKTRKVIKQKADNADEKETCLNNGNDDTPGLEIVEDNSIQLKPVLQLARCELPDYLNKDDSIINEDDSIIIEDESTNLEKEASLKRNPKRAVKTKADPLATKKSINNRRSRSVVNDNGLKNDSVEEDVNESAKEEEDITKINNKKSVAEQKRSVPSKTKSNSKKKVVNKNQNDEDSSDELSDTEYEVKRIMEVKFFQNGKREFLIRWKGYKAEDDTWEKEEHLNCHELLEQFMDNLEKNKNLVQKELRADRKTTKRLVMDVNRLKSRSSKRNRKEINYQED